MKIRTNVRAGAIAVRQPSDRCAPPTTRCAPAPRCTGTPTYDIY